MPAPRPEVVCIGGATVDRKLHTGGPLQPGTSNPVRMERAFGGVARNVAEGVARLGVPAALVSRIGDDEAGRAILDNLREIGVDAGGMAVARGSPSAEYLAVLTPSGDLAYGFAAMTVLDAFEASILRHAAPLLDGASVHFADCNLPPEVLRDLLSRPRPPGTRLAVDAVSVAKVRRLPARLVGLDLLFLNLDEAEAYLDVMPRPGPEALAAALLARGVRQVVLTMGEDGILLATPEAIVSIPAAPARVVDATGAGDALVATVLAGLAQGEPLPEAARRGALAAALTVESPFSVRPDLSPALLAAEVARRDGRPARRGGHD